MIGLCCFAVVLPACGDELDYGLELETTTQNQQPLSSYSPKRGPAFLKLVRAVNADSKNASRRAAISASHNGDACYAELQKEHQYGISYMITCEGSASKNGLLFIFVGTQSPREFCDQLTSKVTNYYHFPWHPPGEASQVSTNTDWTQRLDALSDFVVSEITAYRTKPWTTIQDPVIFAGHSKGGVVAQLFGRARSNIEHDVSFDGPYLSRYTTVISFNAPKPTEQPSVAKVYYDAAYRTVRRYKPVWIERARDVVQQWPVAWPAHGDYQFSTFRTPPAADYYDHGFYHYTDDEMEGAADALQIDPWGGKPREGRFGEGGEPGTCADPGNEEL